jgi:protoheme IX farnesyltransferase
LSSAGLAPERELTVGRFARDVLALTKPRLSGLVVATFMGGMWLARTPVAPLRAFTALLGTILIVSAANALNMYLERGTDGLMSRTRTRPLPEGRLPPLVALLLGVTLALLATPLMVISGGALFAGLGLLAFYSYVCVYTPLKRLSWIALYVGAVPGAMPPLMGWVATRGEVDAAGLVLFAVLFCWQIPHFVAIAVYRAEEYDRAGIQVLPVQKGVTTSIVHAVVFAVLTLAATVALVPLGVAGWIFLCAAIGLGVPLVALSLVGFQRRRSADDQRRWARGLFLYSLAHLTALFLALGFDRNLL